MGGLVLAGFAGTFEAEAQQIEEGSQDHRRFGAGGFSAEARQVGHGNSAMR
jgi:hypothetical protein